MKISIGSQTYEIKTSFYGPKYLTNSMMYEYQYNLVSFYWRIRLDIEEFYNQAVVVGIVNEIDLENFYKGYRKSFENLDIKVSLDKRTKMIEEILSSTELLML